MCPDVAGRGDSDRLADAKLYTWTQYVADMVTLIARLDVEAVSWLGTSMGGLIGMALAALPGNPVARLVLNDASPVIGRAALERIGAYVGQERRFETLEEAESYVRATNFVEIMAPFLSHAALQTCAPTFTLSELGWGLEYLWNDRLRSKGMAIVDCLPVTHIRAVQSNRWKNTRGETAEQECARMLAEWRENK